MGPLQINVSINIGITPSVENLIKGFMLGTAEKVIGSDPLISFDSLEEKLGGKAEHIKKGTDLVNDLKNQVEEQPQHKAEEKHEETKEEKAKTYTEVDVREAMHRIRERIEGVGYKDNTDSEGYKKWHRALTAQFKNIAALFGSDKPCAIADNEGRAGFIAECEKLRIDGDVITNIDAPF